MGRSAGIGRECGVVVRLLTLRNAQDFDTHSIGACDGGTIHKRRSGPEVELYCEPGRDAGELDCECV